MADISKITLPSGNTYDIKDATARDAIAALSGGVFFLGVTTTALTDGATTNPIVVNSQSITAINGNIVVYGNAEFVFDGTKWIEFGDLSDLGALATKDTVALNKGAGGNVLGAATTFSGNSSSVSFGSHTTETFVKSYPGATSKLATTTVPNLSATPVALPTFTMGTGTAAETLIIGTEASGSESASKVTEGTAITVATGSLAANGGGDSVMTGLGTAVTDTAIKTLGAATAAGQTITVGTNDKIKVAKYDDLSVAVS